MNKPLIDMRVWRQFAVLAQELHFGKAAVKLHMTQPPLTQAIAGLERTLGVRLFDRTQRSVQLTAAGLALLPQVVQLLQQASTLPQLAQAAAHGTVGRLRLGFVSTVGFELLPQWLRLFSADCPGVRLELLEATGDIQLQALARGDMDAGLLLHAPGQAPLGVQSLPVACEPLVLALPQPHPLAQQAQLVLADVLACPLVMFPRTSLPTVHDALTALYRAAGCQPNVVQEAIQMQTIVNLVSAELGVAWVPASVQQFQRQGVVYRSVATPEIPAGTQGVPLCETSLVWLDRHMTPALGRWMAFVQGQLQL